MIVFLVQFTPGCQSTPFGLRPPPTVAPAGGWPLNADAPTTPTVSDSIRGLGIVVTAPGPGTPAPGGMPPTGATPSPSAGSAAGATRSPTPAGTPPAQLTPRSTGSPSATPSRTPTRVRIPVTGSVPPSAPYNPLPLAVDAELERSLRDYLGAGVDDYGIAIKHLSDGRGVEINPRREFYAASLFKLEVLYEVYKQRALGILSFDEKLTISPEDAEFDLNTLKWPVGTAVSVRDLVEAMITVSDNTSAMMLYHRVGARNIDQDNRAMGLLDSEILSETLTTSAHDMALLLEIMGRGQAVNRQASDEMIALLSRQRINNRLPALLPAGTRVAHKTGDWDNATHDVGIVYAPPGPYVIALLSGKPANGAALAKLSILVYEHFQTLR